MRRSAVLLFLFAACAGPRESAMRDALQASALPVFEGAPPLPESGDLAAFVASALVSSPGVHAAHARWRAATHRIARARTLPDPVVSYGAFLRHVETRVGPQRHRIGIRQTLPWPTKLTAGQAQQTALASARQAAFEAVQLAVAASVAEAYWDVWFLDTTHRLMSEHDAVLEAMRDAARERMKLGRARLSDVAQLDLRIARHHDHHGRHREKRRAAATKLAALLGQPRDAVLPALTDTPGHHLPTASEATLFAAAAEHPDIHLRTRESLAAQHAARRAGAGRVGAVVLGFDALETRGGTDPMILSVGWKVPLSWHASTEDMRAAEADATAASHAARASALRIAAECEGALGAVHDSARRMRLVTRTLVPQAETALASVRGGLASGEVAMPAVLLAQRDLLALRVAWVEAQRDHAVAWARLDALTGGVASEGSER